MADPPEGRAHLATDDPFRPRTTVTPPAAKRADTPTSARTAPYVLVIDRSST
jgi:hypothetical protein